MVLKDIDSEMSAKEISSYVHNILHEFGQLLYLEIAKISVNEAKITFRKIKRIKKHVLFKLLKKVTKKNE